MRLATILALGLAALGSLAGCDVISPNSGCGPFGKAPALPAAGTPKLKDLLCVSDDRFGLSNGTADAIDRPVHLQLLNDLGVTHVRHDLRWADLEPTKGDLHWEKFDPGIADIRAAGLDLVGILDYGVPWASSQTTSDPYYPPDDPADFAGFAGAVAAHYAGQVSRYEIWNEENSGFRFWKPKADPAAYATLLHDASVAVHAADPTAQVAYGGLFFHGQAIMSATDFLTQSFAARPDLASDFDAFGFHPYPLYPPSVPPEAGDNGETPVDEMVSSLRTILDANGAKGKPIWATEYGWPDFAPVTPDLQAAYLVRETMWLAAAHVPLACDFTLMDGPDAGQFPPEDSFGLYAFSSAVGGHGAIKPAGKAMQFLATRLGNLEMVGSVKAKLGLGGGQYGFLLVDQYGDSFAYVLWSYDDKYAGTAVLPVPQNWSVRAYDATGAGVQTEGTTGSISVHFGAMPVVVVFDVMGCA